ncbi:hypothetical protein SNE40_001578 [Patella caerulea]|uniref:SAM domain-containing protein n=1 Tax=Patella caerulea TaxID=87958 RepID=A0AAN8KE84_PATCE
MSKDRRSKRRRAAPARFTDLFEVSEPDSDAGAEQSENNNNENGDMALTRLATECWLSHHTMATLVKMGFDCMGALALLEVEDFAEVDINKGQRKLCLFAARKAALVQTQQTEVQTECRENSAGLEVARANMADEVNMQKLIEKLSHNMRGGANAPVQITGDSGNQALPPLVNDVSWNDPQIFLRKAATQGKMFLDIVDFIPHGPVSNVEDDNFTLSQTTA